MKRNTNRFLLYFLFISALSFAQNSTINKAGKNEVAAAHKVLLIPFEQRLYLSEIDHHINAETKLNARQIKHTFRDALNEQIFKAFKSIRYNVTDLMEDTVKYKKDLESVYQYLNYDYQKVPDQNNYKPPVHEKGQKTIEKGQISVETDLEARFMNAKMSDTKVMQSLSGKYRCDLFVYVNQLFIKAAGSTVPGEFADPKADRSIIVHYTVYTKEMKEINSGIAETKFEYTLNNPKKISEKYFSKIGQMIAERTQKALEPPKK